MFALTARVSAQPGLQCTVCAGAFYRYRAMWCRAMWATNQPHFRCSSWGTMLMPSTPSSSATTLVMRRSAAPNSQQTSCGVSSVALKPTTSCSIPISSQVQAAAPVLARLALQRGVSRNAANSCASAPGYVGSAEFLSTVVRIVRRMREINPDLIYVCDPVMGDDGKLYVPEDLVPIFRDELTPLANIITPNQFELELLTGLPTDDRASAYRAIDALHTRGIPTVIVSSFHIDEHHMEVLGSRSDAHQTFAIGFEKIAARFTGTGDLFSALVLAWSHLHESSEFPLAVSKALSTLQAVIQRTVAAAAGSTDPRSLELRLIDAKRDIEAPDTTRFPSVIQDRLG
eukprot:m.170181 g.170181  ORF g.170181 m.170181 type:complete len:343 (-) comp10375_c0_seq9:3516-4544(-)